MHAAPKLLDRRTQRGFTLIEILIALLVGLFLMGALLTVVQTNRRVFGEQNQLSQLQDNERMALTMMGDVIQSAGYFPQTQPLLNTSANTLIAIAPFGTGQSISGVSAVTPSSDQIQVRYMTTGGDNILNCSGLSNPVGGLQTLYTNVFQLQNGQLVCFMNGTLYTLVGGTTAPASGLDIQSMTILYGVKTNAGALGDNVDTYMPAESVTSGVLWSNVISVMVTFQFTNPLYNAANPGQQLPTFKVQRVFDVMNQTGPTL